MNRLALVDANGICRPAFEMGGDAARSLMKLLEQLPESYTHAVVAFDSTRGSERKRMYPEYKATRPEPKPGLIEALTSAWRTAESFGFCCVSAAGWEADDVIATLVARAEGKSEVVIISRDKDFRQLLSPTVSMWHAKTGFFTEADLRRQNRLTPAQWLDYQALVGDSTDNIKGAPGIGEKTAHKLLQEYGDLDEIYRSLDSLKPSLRESLQEHREDVVLSYELVTLNRFLDLDIDPRKASLR